VEGMFRGKEGNFIYTILSISGEQKIVTRGDLLRRRNHKALIEFYEIP
jgi:hypothetical protein